ncbi:MAG: hypothetical protein KDJ88_14735 [Bauldia sp.]|nr:hypothetical protein [Bauldia sp.]
MLCPLSSCRWCGTARYFLRRRHDRVQSGRNRLFKEKIVVTVIDKPTTGTVSIENDELYLTNTGSITNASGLALNLQGNVFAFVNGDVTGDNGIQATGYGDRFIIIGAFSTVESGSSGNGIEIYGDTTVRNEGNFSAQNSAVFVSGATTGVFTNNGTMVSYQSIFAIAYDTELASKYTIRNLSDGSMTSTFTNGIFSNVGGLTLSVNNKGYIEGQGHSIYIYGTLLLANTGTINGAIYAANYQDSLAETSGSRIVNKGMIDAGDSETAIRLGSGDDFVRNKGTIEGAVRLGGGSDKFVGAKQGEVVYGGGGDDHLNTRGGADLIAGGRGDDVIRSGGGPDSIVFDQGDGKDKIFGFKPGKDMIDLSDFAFSDFKDLKPDIDQKGSKVVIDLGGHDQIMLAHVDKADLSAHDFIL